MKPAKFFEILTSSHKILMRKAISASFWSMRFVIFLIFLLLILVSVQSLADIPSSARVIDFEGSGSDFWIRREPTARETDPVRKGVEMRTGGSLSVPTKDYSASFGFVTSDQRYNGLIVKTYDKGTYTFPCQVQGHFIIAWSGEGSDSRACRSDGSGITIARSPNKTLSKLAKSVGLTASTDASGNKQTSDQQGDANLAVNPAEGQTLIRTSSTVSVDTKYDYPYYECATINSRGFVNFPGSVQTSGSVQACQWKCIDEDSLPGTVRTTCTLEPNSTTTENVENRRRYKYVCTTEGSARTGRTTTCRWESDGDPSRSIITTTTENVSIEAFKGDILIKSKENPQGAKVKEGQKYSYPGGKIEAINAGEEANSCEMLKFLNAAYWSSSETPKSVSDGIAEQLKQHRQALGVSGRSPNNLSALEKNVVDDLSFMRTNPSAYADRLETRKQYFYTNWLKLPGETLDPGKRVRAVDEAIAFLRSKQPLPPFSLSKGMSSASRDHVNGQGRTGKKFGHTSDDGRGYWDRLRAHGSIGCVMGENVSYYDASLASDSKVEAQVAVVEMLINDGQRRAGSRDNIFNPDFQVIGVACGSHKFLRSMCVITYAGGYLEKT